MLTPYPLPPRPLQAQSEDGADNYLGQPISGLLEAEAEQEARLRAGGEAAAAEQAHEAGHMMMMDSGLQVGHSRGELVEEGLGGKGGNPHRGWGGSVEGGGGGGSGGVWGRGGGGATGGVGEVGGVC